jgi:nitroreductase
MLADIADVNEGGSTFEGAYATLDGLFAARHSCRAFRPDPVPRATIEQVLSTAQRAASWCNVQPWQVAITGGDATERLRSALLAAAGSPPVSDIPFPGEYAGAALARRRECGFALYDSLGIAKGDRAASAAQARQNFALFGAPHAAVITTEARLGPYSLVDCGGYVMSFLLACTGLGIATIAQAALASRSDVLRSFFQLGEDRQVVCGISFGYADAAHPANGFRTTRAALNDVVTWHD